MYDCHVFCHSNYLIWVQIFNWMTRQPTFWTQLKNLTKIWHDVIQLEWLNKTSHDEQATNIFKLSSKIQSKWCTTLYLTKIWHNITGGLSNQHIWIQLKNVIKMVYNTEFSWKFWSEPIKMMYNTIFNKKAICNITGWLSNQHIWIQLKNVIKMMYNTELSWKFWSEWCINII